MKALIINPGSTSTKIAVFEDKVEIFQKSIEHDQAQIEKYESIGDQYEMRRDCIVEALKENGFKRESLDIIMARGGLLPPVEAGAYEVNDDMVYQLRYHPQNEHASNLGAAIAYVMAQDLGIKAYIYDPVTVDELMPIVKITGLPEMQRKGMGHNLNMRASAIKYAESINRPYNEITVVVAHLGGGITLSLHEKGRMVDMISDDEGPFSPERSGGLPTFQVIKMATTEIRDFKAMMKKVKAQSGLKAHCNVTDAREIEKMIANGDEKAKLVYEAMALNVAKNIAKLAVVVSGKVDSIILTGGMAYSEMLTNWIKERIEFIAPVTLIPGENEMNALAMGAFRILSGEEKAKIFKRDKS
jgi:butyrate kinase